MSNKSSLDRAVSLVQEAYAEKKANNYPKAKQCFTDAVEIMLPIASGSVSAGMKKYLNQEMKTYLAEIEEINLLSQLEELQVGADLAPKRCQEIEDLIQSGQKISSDADKLYENDAIQESIDAYTAATEKLLKARELEEDAIRKAKIVTLVESVLSRAEIAKKTLKGDAHKVIKVGPAGLTTAEIKVLHASSNINGRIFLPWMDEDSTANYKTSKPFDDPDGRIPLASSQKPHFKRWARVSEIFAVPTVGQKINTNHLKQSLIADCSFIGSLALTLHYEYRFKKRLVKNMIYPQDHNGNPIFNPSGQYAVKLFLNGIWRKVIIDDYFPVDEYNRFLCAYVTESNDIWLSLLEKAYMKVNGGYDFPGSNSGADLMALTGWFPERVSFAKAELDKVWSRMVSGTKSGDCLITVSTEPGLTPEVEEAMGLVQGHAYAVLEVLEVGGHRLLMIKNPWAHKRWKGKFSFDDQKSWTPQLKKLLHFEQFNLQDNGMFWIDFDSLCLYFPNMHMNWNPSLLPYTFVTHQLWPVEQGPKNDVTTIGYNPQIRLKLQSGGKPAIVWIILSKHFIQENPGEEEDFLTLHVMNSIDGGRLYRNEDSKKRSVYTNSLHCLVTFETDPTEKQEYILVVSQMEKKCDIRFSVQIKASCNFEAIPLPLSLGHVTRVCSQWAGNRAAGSTSSKSYFNNPQFALEMTETKSISRDSAEVLIRVETERSIATHFYIFKGVDNSTTGVRNFHSQIVDTGMYNYGLAYLKMSLAPNQRYIILPSTYEEGTEGSFTIIAESILPVKLTAVPSS